MKKLWLVLLSLGLVMAFSVSAFAVDIKVGADFYVGGLYLNKTMIADGDSNGDYVNPSTAFFYQRLRVGTDFIVSPSLKLVTRFDAMERIWGGQRSNTWLANQGGYYPMSAETQFENENIAVDIVYIDYTSPVGQFQIGYQPDSTWGTVWGNDSTGPTGGLIKWASRVGPVVLVANYSKFEDNSSSAVSQNSWYWQNRLNATRTDRDSDSYRAGFVYPFKSPKANGQAGILMIYSRDASNRGQASTFDGYLTRAYKAMPYVKATIGPVALEAEINYTWGDALLAEDGSVHPPGPYPPWFTNSSANQRIDSLSAYLAADAKFGMWKVGGTFAYVQGDDNPYDSVAHNANTGGKDYNPCLLLFNYDTVNYWIGGIYGHDGTPVGGPMSNAYFLQGRVGVSPTPQLDILASLSWAQADKKPYNASGSQYASGDYGWEIDLTGTYKITNNLSYMLGAGYLFAGDIYNGAVRTDATNRIVDDFILINKLTLSF